MNSAAPRRPRWSLLFVMLVGGCAVGPELHAAGSAGRRSIRSNANGVARRRRRATAADAAGGFGPGGAVVARICVDAAERHGRSRVAWQPDARGRASDVVGRLRDAGGDARRALSAGRSRRQNVARQQRRVDAHRRRFGAQSLRHRRHARLRGGRLRRHSTPRRATGCVRRFPARSSSARRICR